MNVLARVNRILKPLKNFKFELKNSTIHYFLELPNKKNETIIGIYENIPDSIRNCIIITDKSLHLEKDGKWIIIDFNNIEKIQLPSKNSITTENSGVYIYYDNSKEQFIPVLGKKDRFYDFYAFARFLMRVSDDVKKNRKK